MALIVLIRVLLSVSANAVQKKLVLSGVRGAPMWVATYGLMLTPAVIIAALNPHRLTAEFWINILLCGALDGIGNLAMIAALQATDLSIFGPLNGFRPIFALIFGWLFLGEIPTVAGGLGVSITVLGAVLLFTGDRQTTANTSPAPGAFRVILMRAMGLILSTWAAVFLKRAATLSSTAPTLAVWTGFGFASVMAVAIISRGSSGPSFREQIFPYKYWIASHAVIFFVMQWLTIDIFIRTPLSYSFVFFQLAMVVQVIAGRFLFNEPALSRRLLACGIMAVGSGLVAWKG